MDQKGDNLLQLLERFELKSIAQIVVRVIYLDNKLLFVSKIDQILNSLHILSNDHAKGRAFDHRKNR